MFNPSLPPSLPPDTYLGFVRLKVAVLHDVHHVEVAWPPEAENDNGQGDYTQSHLLQDDKVWEVDT